MTPMDIGPPTAPCASASGARCWSTASSRAAPSRSMRKPRSSSRYSHPGAGGPSADDRALTTPTAAKALTYARNWANSTRREPAPPNPDDLERLEADLDRAWHAPDTDPRLKKRILRALIVAEREEPTETRLGSTARCCGRRRHRQANSVRVCSPTSRRVASLRPRSAGLTALTPAPRTLVQTGSCRRCSLIHPLHVVVDVLSRMTLFRATVDS